jgi:hypothetical protein
MIIGYYLRPFLISKGIIVRVMLDIFGRGRYIILTHLRNLGSLLTGPPKVVFSFCYYFIACSILSFVTNTASSTTAPPAIMSSRQNQFQSHQQQQQSEPPPVKDDKKKPSSSRRNPPATKDQPKGSASAIASVLMAQPRFNLAATFTSLPSGTKRTPSISSSGGGPVLKKVKTNLGGSSANSVADQEATTHSSPPKPTPAHVMRLFSLLSFLPFRCLLFNCLLWVGL